MTRATPEPISFSVIVASRDRPVWLRRCLRALAQLDYPMFEIIVVSNAAGLAVVDDPHIRRLQFDHANLSAARNQGVRGSGGRICAFIDDDAVPEPMWLQHLEDAFHRTGAAAMTGYVRGRNGISFQSRLCSVDAEAETHVEQHSGTEPFVPRLEAGRAVKLVGTNFAVRREALVQIGGFDEHYRYYLEDSDLSMRLAQAGHALGVAPLAEVHHGFAPSLRRSRLRAPRDLFDIGRSTVIYLRKHTRSAEAGFFARVREREKLRLEKHLALGAIEPRDMRNRLKELQKGWEEGLACPLRNPVLKSEATPFQRYPAKPSGHVVTMSRFLSKRSRLVRNAEEIVRGGGRASVFSFSLTPFRHHVRYGEGGVWLQTGGVFGRSNRKGSVFKWCRFADRVKAEIARVAKSRGIGETTGGKWWDQTR